MKSDRLILVCVSVCSSITVMLVEGCDTHHTPASVEGKHTSKHKPLENSQISNVQKRNVPVSSTETVAVITDVLSECYTNSTRPYSAITDQRKSLLLCVCVCVL